MFLVGKHRVGFSCSFKRELRVQFSCKMLCVTSLKSPWILRKTTTFHLKIKIWSVTNFVCARLMPGFSLSSSHGVAGALGGQGWPRQGWGQPSATSGGAGHVSCRNDGAIHEPLLALEGNPVSVGENQDWGLRTHPVVLFLFPFSALEGASKASPAFLIKNNRIREPQSHLGQKKP